MLGCCCCSMVCCWPCRTRGGSCGGGGMRRRRCPSCSSRLSPSCTLTQASSRHHGVSKNIAGSMDTAAAHGAQHKLSVPQWGVPAAASYMMGCQPGHMRLTSALTSLFQPSTTNTSSAKPSVVLNTCASRMFRPKSPCSSTSSNISAQKTYNPAPKMHLTAKLLDRLQLTTAGCNNCMCTKHLLLRDWPPVLCKKHWALWRGLVRHAHHTHDVVTISWTGVQLQTTASAFIPPLSMQLQAVALKHFASAYDPSPRWCTDAPLHPTSG